MQRVPGTDQRIEAPGEAGAAADEEAILKPKSGDVLVTQKSFPRSLTDQEKAWLRQALSLLPTGEYLGGGRWRDVKTGKTKPLDPPIDPEPYLAQIEDLVVVARCGCGSPNCCTVDFQHFRPGRSVALVHTNTDDGRDLIVFEDEETGYLTQLEVI